MYDYEAWRAHDAGARALQIASDIDVGFKGRACFGGYDAPAPEAPAADWRAEREQAWNAIQAKAADEARVKCARPFRFEDLNGAPEPVRWGPIYPNLGASVEKWRKLERKRELTKDEVCAYGASVGEAIRRLNRPKGFAPISLKCTVQNTCGTCNTVEGEAARHRHWLEVRLPAIKAECLAGELERAAKRAAAPAKPARRARKAKVAVAA